MKLIIAGPPHSGKSVFIELLVRAIRECGLYPLKLDATPDGETNYVKENYGNDALVKALRKKGEYTEKLREYITRCITNSKHPLMLIDIGGKFNEKDIPMLENATHAIVLSGGEVVSGANAGKNDFSESVKEWKSFFSQMNIPVLASIYSDYAASEDYQMDDGTLAVHHLERADMKKVKDFASAGYSSILKVREIIFSQMKKLEREDVALGGTPQKCSDYDRLVAISKRKVHEDRDGARLVLSGGFSSHELAKRCVDEVLGGIDGADGASGEVHFHDAKLGENIPIAPLALGKTNRAWFEEPEYIGSFEGRKVFQVRFLGNHSRNVFLTEDLHGLQVPAVPEGSIVKVSSGGGLWVCAILALSYALSGKCIAVGVDMPKDKLSAVVHSRAEDVHTFETGERLSSGVKGVIPDLPVVYIDMDGVLADFEKGKQRAFEEDLEALEACGGQVKNMPGFFEKLQPIEDSIAGAKWVAEHFNAFILSAAPWGNPTALQAKQDWIKHYFTDSSGFNPFKRKVIITHHKELLKGDILIDDRITNGVSGFSGEHIWFGKSTKAKSWEALVKTLQAGKKASTDQFENQIESNK